MSEQLFALADRLRAHRDEKAGAEQRVDRKSTRLNSSHIH